MRRKLKHFTTKEQLNTKETVMQEMRGKAVRRMENKQQSYGSFSFSVITLNGLNSKRQRRQNGLKKYSNCAQSIGDILDAETQVCYLYFATIKNH